MRRYDELIQSLGPAGGPASPDHDVMSRVCDALWSAFGGEGDDEFSWLGFYLFQADAMAAVDAARPAGMVLGPRRDKPACSPIGLHGACGQSYERGVTLVVRDVADLGAGYIACDPRDRSELVIPCWNEDGSRWGVFDADSFGVGTFDAHDAGQIERLLVHSGLSARRAEATAVEIT